MIEVEASLGDGAAAAAGLGATVTEAPGYPSPVSEAQKPASGFSSADPGAVLAGAQVRVSGGFRSGAKHQDLLTLGLAESGTFTSGGGEAIAFAYDRTTGILTLSGNATAAAYDEAFEAVRFAIAGDDPDDGGTAASRTIAYSTFDGAAYSDVVEASVAVVAVNDAPTVELLANQAARLGGETVVDASSGSDREVSTTALADGGYLTTWTHSSSMGGDPATIHAQRFDASGAAAGARIVIPAPAGSSATNSDSAAFAGGGFVITWEAAGQIGSQRYTASGAKLGSQIVSSSPSGAGAVEPSVATLTGGGFVVTWSTDTYSSTWGPRPSEVFAQRYNASGVAQGGPVRVNSFTEGSQHSPVSVGLADGGYVVAWTSWQQDAPGAGIYAQRYSAAGIAQGGEFRINATVANNQRDPSIAALADGGFVVTWTSTQDNAFGDPHIYARRFDSSGNAVGGEIRVDGADSGYLPVVTGLADGGFAIVWQAWEIMTRRYDSDGNPVGPQAQVNTGVAGDQWHPAVAGLAGGDLVVGWAHLNSGDGFSGVSQQRYTDGLAVDEGFALVLNGRISVDDVDSGAGPITVTLSVDEGEIYYVTLNANAASVTGNGTSTLRITGSLADVKAFLGADTFLGYQNDADAPPANARLIVRIEEEGGSDPLAAEAEIVIGIVPVNDRPVLSAPTSATLAFTEGDGPLALMQGVAASDPDLPATFRNGSFSLAVSGSTGALQLREGSAFRLTVDMYGNQLVSYVDGASTSTVGYLTGIGTRSVSVSFRPGMTQAIASDLIDDFVFTDSSENPAAGNRIVTASFNDGRNTGLGTTAAATRTQTISVTPVNDAPIVEYASGFGYEDMGRTRVFLQGKDHEGSPLTYTLASLPENGLLYSASSGGTPLSAGAVLAANASGTLSLYFQPNSNWSGSASFAYSLSDGTLSTGPATATITVNPSNDMPRFSGIAGVSAIEQTAVDLLPGATVSDLELDLRNGGAGDYAGATLSVYGNPTRATDQFSLSSGPNFIVDGNLLKAGGLAFAAVTANGNGTLTVAFTGAETPATRALVNEVMQAIRYTNASDSPSTSHSLMLKLDDGGATNGQGYGGTAYGADLIIITTTPVNDRPAIDLNGAAAGATFASYAEDSAATGIAPAAIVADPDSGNFDQGHLLVTMGQSLQPYDRFAVVIQGNGPGQIGFNASGITYGGVHFATRSGAAAPGDLLFVFNANATQAAVQALVRSIGYFAETDTPVSGSRPVGFEISDGDGATSFMANAYLTIAAADDPAVARDDKASTAENAVATGNVLLDSGSGADSDVDGPAPAVAAVNGDSSKVGQAVILASGARLTLNADGSYAYDPNGRFDHLTSGSSGAVNTSATDSFTYSLANGGSATVTVTVTGVAGAGDRLSGDSGGNFINGTSSPDVFHMYQGGDDTVLAGAGNDNIFFGGSLTDADLVNGGEGADTLVLQGNYAGGLVLSPSVTLIENISILGGGNTAFGDPGTNRYDYVLTTNDANFAAGIQARINGAALLEGEDFFFDGRAETNASFVVYGGKGKDTLLGGFGNDIFIYPEERFAPGDTVNGGPGGYDGIFFRGNYTIDFNAPGYFGLMNSIENMTLTSITDERYARGGDAAGFDYDITLADNMLLAGIQLTVSGVMLQPYETMIVDGSQETDGTFRFFAGKSDDILMGGANADLLLGNLGADVLSGGGGADIFRYDATSDSTSASRDHILDLTPGIDRIDLSRIDANAGAAGDQAFAWIGDSAFSGVAGQLRFSGSGFNRVIEGDTNGDGVADFAIAVTLEGATPLGASDFFL